MNLKTRAQKYNTAPSHISYRWGITSASTAIVVIIFADIAMDVALFARSFWNYVGSILSEIVLAGFET